MIPKDISINNNYSINEAGLHSQSSCVALFRYIKEIFKINIRKNLYLIPLSLYSLSVLTSFVAKISKSEFTYVSIVSILGILVIFLVRQVLIDSFRKLKPLDYLFYLPSLAFFQILLTLIIAIVLINTGHTSASLLGSDNNFLATINDQFDNQTLLLVMNHIWIGIIGPFVENILFIYFIQGQLLRKMNQPDSSKLSKALQIILITILFMCWHLKSLNDFSDPGFYRYIALIWMPFIYVRTNSLAKTIVAHIGLNLIGILIYFL